MRQRTSARPPRGVTFFFLLDLHNEAPNSFPHSFRLLETNGAGADLSTRHGTPTTHELRF